LIATALQQRRKLGRHDRVWADVDGEQRGAGELIEQLEPRPQGHQMQRHSEAHLLGLPEPGIRRLSARLREAGQRLDSQQLAAVELDDRLAGDPEAAPDHDRLDAAPGRQVRNDPGHGTLATNSPSHREADDPRRPRARPARAR
jgi:hypothetical protein